MSSSASTVEDQNAKHNQGRGVTLGDVTGGIAHAVVAGGNVENVHIGDKIYTRSQLEELRDYLRTAVATYATTQMGRLLKTPATPTEPYKFLNWFEIEDANIFFGREEATQALYDKVTRSRLTALHAKSGAGKTSLLNAGLAPRLIREGRIPIFARAFNDPVLAVKRALAPASVGKWPDLLHKLSLTDFLGEVCQLLPRNVQELVLILDQFEEFFIFWPLREQRQSFIDDFARCYADRDLQVRFLISLRKDYYSDLAEFERHIPTIFQNQVWLAAMSRQQAAHAITVPVARLRQPVTYAPELLETLLDDLAGSGMELSHLQIICTQLFEDALATDALQIDLSGYERLGRASGILGYYLNGVLAGFPGSGESIAKAILKELVSSEATKRVVDYPMLTNRVVAKSPEFDDTLARLVNARLVRRDEIEGNVVYEMAHEYLIDEIKQWLNASDLAFKQIEELLTREVANWQIYNTLIPLDRLQLIHAQYEHFQHLDDAIGECLLYSALKSNYKIEIWVKLIARTNAQLLWLVLTKKQVLYYIEGRTLMERLYKQNRTLIRTIGAHYTMPALTALGADDETIRLEAVEELGQLKDTHAIKALTTVLVDESNLVRNKAFEILKRLGNADIGLLIIVLKEENFYEDSCKKAIQLLGQLGDSALEPLVAALKDNTWTRHDAIFEAIGLIGVAAVEPLITMLGNKNSIIRRRAVIALGKIKDTCVIELLIIVLKDKDPQCRKTAIEILGKRPSAVDHLLAALKDEDQNVRQGASSALTNPLLTPRDTRAFDPLITALKDEDGIVRGNVAQAITWIQDTRAVEPLIAALNDEDWNARSGAIWALGRLGDRRAVEPLIAALKGKLKDHTREGELICLVLSDIDKEWEKEKSFLALKEEELAIS